MPESTTLAERPTSVKDYLALPAYRDRFHEVMGKRANQFMAAITAVSQMPALKDANPRSVIASAMVAATLDLPVNPTLGQSYIVAYGGEAQFQIGYRGLIQLALRSGQYKRMNSGPVNVEVFAGYDGVGEPSLDWSKYDPLKEIGGYFCAFELVNGFTKVVYWSKAQVEAHAKRFSKAYAKGYATPWKSDFDAMATKTVIKNALTKWGMLSVEMQKAVVHDQGVQSDVDAEVKYLDGDDKTAVEDSVPGDPTPRPAPPARAKKGAAAVASTPAAPEVVGELVTEPEKLDSAPRTVERDGKTILTESKEEVRVRMGEPAPAAPRAFLNDKEEITATCTVAEVGAIDITKDGAIHPSVQAVLKGDFVGTVFHIGGGVKEGDKTVPGPLWQVGASLKLKLFGKLNTKAGKVMTFVSSAEGVSQVETMEA